MINHTGLLCFLQNPSPRIGNPFSVHQNLVKRLVNMAAAAVCIFLFTKIQIYFIEGPFFPHSLVAYNSSFPYLSILQTPCPPPYFLILKLDPLPASDIDSSATIASSLLLILLLRKPFPSCHAQLLMGPVAVLVRHIRVRCQPHIDFGVFGHALKGRSGLLGRGLRAGRGGGALSFRSAERDLSAVCSGGRV